MKKALVLTVLFLSSLISVFAQETPESERDYVDDQNMTVSEVEELIQSQGLINRLDFVFGIEPVLSLNTHKKNDQGKFISAPSPISIPVYIGLSIPNYTAISFQPSLRFFTGYDLVYEDLVLPAEVENRTGLTFSFLLNLPVAFKLKYKDKYSWSVIAGIAGLFRFAVLPPGVKQQDSGAKGSASADVEYMNNWFYKNLRFLYLSAAIDWMFYYGKTKYGPEFSVFFPVSVFSDKSVDGLMLGAGIKVEF